MSFTLITITADYGPRSVGSVSLLASAEMLDSVDLLIKPAVTYSAALKAGRLSLVVPANDDATTAPTGVTYLVTEDIQGAPSNTYRVLVPSAAVGGTIDLSQLAPIVTQPSLVYPNRQGATGATGPGFTAITVTANYGPRAVGSVSLVASAEMLNDVTQEIKPTLPYVGTLKAGRLPSLFRPMTISIRFQRELFTPSLRVYRVLSKPVIRCKSLVGQRVKL